jgi:hypothetical protein
MTERTVSRCWEIESGVDMNGSIIFKNGPLIQTVQDCFFQGVHPEYPTVFQPDLATDLNLAAQVAVWPELAKAIKAGIVAMIEAALT